MTPETAPSNPARAAGPIVIAAAVVLVAALVSFARISVPGSESTASDELAWPAGLEVQSFRDRDLGLEITLPSNWERVFEPAESSGSDVRAVFRDPVQGATLALEAWDSTSLAPFPLWLGVMAGDMSAAGAAPANAGPASAEPIPNAGLAGTPAWLMWRASSGGTPATYAAFVQKGGRYLRLKLDHPSAGASGEDFRRVLASVEWPEGSGEVTVPELPGAQAP
jgi:hypothetical protein